MFESFERDFVHKSLIPKFKQQFPLYLFPSCKRPTSFRAVCSGISEPFNPRTNANKNTTHRYAQQIDVSLVLSRRGFVSASINIVDLN